MATGQQIVTNALTILNVVDASGSISASESADLLSQVNTFLDSMAADATLIPSISTASYALTANQNPYPMGPTATAPFNVARPVRIDQAILVSTVGSGTTRKPLRLIGSTEYFSKGDLKAAATTADVCYVDYADTSTGALSIYLHPVPSCPTVTALELETWNAIAAFALAVNQNLPPGYEYYITNTLAFLSLSRYGAVVNQETTQLVTGIAGQARDRIRELNQKNRLLDPATVPPTQEQLQAAQAKQQQQGAQR